NGPQSFFYKNPKSIDNSHTTFEIDPFKAQKHKKRPKQCPSIADFYYCIAHSRRFSEAKRVKQERKSIKKRPKQCPSIADFY
ncbi:hypothetical protein, partial [Winogradskyella pacifica]|uniref:hypothetical protein n=1 Tax=Winogradskyella pacifica TaxID=664642 RepID=UPI001C5357B1